MQSGTKVTAYTERKKHKKTLKAREVDKMKKEHKKTVRKKVNPAKKVCEQCGNGGYTRKDVFRCRYCGYVNGIDSEYGVEITRGGIDER